MRRPLVAGIALIATAILTACGSGGRVSPASPTPSPAGTPTASPTSSPAPSPTPSSIPSRTPTPSPAATALPASLTGHVISRLPTSQHVVALTFDGGSGAQGAAPVLSTLRATGVPATFFLTGQFAVTYPQTARALAASGVVGNHTMTHPHLPQLSTPAVTAEVAGAESTIASTIGRAARPWFRFPYGEYDARTLGIVNGLGYAAIGWTVDAGGWKGRAGAGSVDDIVARVIAQLQPGAIVLMHLGAAPDGTTLDADALPILIPAIRAAGYTFVTVEALR